MIDMITYINARLDRLMVFPIAFAAILTVAVVMTAVLEDGSAPAAQTAEDDSLTTIAAAVP